MDGEEGEVVSQIEKSGRIVDLFKELSKIQVKEFNQTDQFIKIKNLKRVFDGEVHQSQIVFNQMSTQLNNIQKKFNEESLKSSTNTKKKYSQIVQSIRSKLSDYQQTLKDGQKYINDKSNQFRKQILNRKLELVDIQQLSKTNSQFFVSSNQLKLNTLTKKIQNSFNQQFRPIQLQVKQKYRNLKVQIQKQRKQTIKSQKQMQSKLFQIQDIFDQMIKQQQKNLNNNFTKHYNSLQKIFQVISQDLLNQQT